MTVLAELNLDGGSTVVLRRAAVDDVPGIVDLLVDDELGATRYRGAGLGAAMITWAISVARRRECAAVQLTTDKSRTEAHRFYARLGFVASHEGLKLTL